MNAKKKLGFCIIAKTTTMPQPPIDTASILENIKHNLHWIIAAVGGTGVFQWIFNKKKSKAEVESVITQAAESITKTVEDRYKAMQLQQEAMYTQQIANMTEMHAKQIANMVDIHEREKQEIKRDFKAQIAELTQEVETLREELHTYTESTGNDKKL